MDYGFNCLYKFGAFCLDPAQRRLTLNGEPVHVAPKAFDVLLVLVQRAGNLVDKSELMQAVWPGLFVEEGNVTAGYASRFCISAEALRCESRRNAPCVDIQSLSPLTGMCAPVKVYHLAGASSGIGFEVAKRLLASGYHLAKALTIKCAPGTSLWLMAQIIENGVALHAFIAICLR